MKTHRPDRTGYIRVIYFLKPICALKSHLRYNEISPSFWYLTCVLEHAPAFWNRSCDRSKSHLRSQWEQRSCVFRLWHIPVHLPERPQRYSFWAKTLPRLCETYDAFPPFRKIQLDYHVTGWGLVALAFIVFNMERFPHYWLLSRATRSWWTNSPVVGDCG